MFPDVAEMHVLDLGGTAEFWEQFPVQPRRLTTINPMEYVHQQVTPDWHQNFLADACEPPDEVAGTRFDIVFSNSTIEHVGDRARRRRFADAVHALSDRHWIQTPNRAFPIEPHVLFPFEQHLPDVVRARIQLYWPMVHTRPRNLAEGYEYARSTELLGEAEFVEIFPRSRIELEDIMAPLPAKSLIAVLD